MYSLKINAALPKPRWDYCMSYSQKSNHNTCVDTIFCCISVYSTYTAMNLPMNFIWHWPATIWLHTMIVFSHHQEATTSVYIKGGRSLALQPHCQFHFLQVFHASSFFISTAVVWGWVSIFISDIILVFGVISFSDCNHCTALGLMLALQHIWSVLQLWVMTDEVLMCVNFFPFSNLFAQSRICTAAIDWMFMFFLLRLTRLSVRRTLEDWPGCTWKLNRKGSTTISRLVYP